MEFGNIKIKEIEAVIKYRSSNKNYSAKNRKTHIVGLSYSGNEVHIMKNKSFCVEENCIYYFNQKDDYDVKIEEPSLSHSVHFTTYDNVETDSFCIKIKNIKEISNELDKIDRQKRIKGDSNHYLYSCVYKLLGMIDGVCRKKYSVLDSRMSLAKEYLDLNFSNENCLKDVYEQSELSRRHFDYLFKINFDTTPNRYILMKRIERAKELLRSVNLNIEEIAYMIGYKDVYYFSKVFKDVTGVTPSSYKRKK